MQILLALTPLVVSLLMLTLLQQNSRRAGLVTLVITCMIVLAIAPFRLTLAHLLLTLGLGAATSLTILSILFPALLLYQMQRITGAMQIVSRGMVRLCPVRDIQVLLLVLGFSPLIESICGFGVGMVLIIPLFIALGIVPARAALLGILGQLTTAWGAMGVSLVLAATLTGLNADVLGTRTALLMAPLPVRIGILTLLISGGRQAARWWSAALAAGMVLAGGTWLFSQLPGIELAGLLASLPPISLLVSWGQLALRRSPGSFLLTSSGLAQADEGTLPSLWKSVVPYLLLTAYLLLTRLIVPLRQWLQTHDVLVVRVIDFRWPVLYSPGLWVLLSVLVMLPCYPVDRPAFRSALSGCWQQFAPTAVAIISFLATGQLMLASGMTTVLGAATASLGSNYGWMAPWLGALGGWLTGSNVGANAMFALLQQEVAVRTRLPLDWLMGAQNGACSMASPSCVLLATTSAHLPQGAGYVFRRIGPVVVVALAIIMITLVGVLSCILPWTGTPGAITARFRKGHTLRRANTTLACLTTSGTC